MITISPHPSGAVLSVHAQPGAAKNECKGEYNEGLKVSVTQAPEKGKANKAILELLAKQLGVKKSQIELVSGEIAPKKRFLFHGLAPDRLREMLRESGATKR